MQWLSQNWVWLALIFGAIWLFSRGRHGGMMGGCGMHGMTHDAPAGEDMARGAGASRPPVDDSAVAPAAERGASAHRHGRGGCC